MSELTLDSVLESKTYVKENSMIKFETPETYIAPFIEVVSGITDRFRVQGVRGSVNAEQSGEENIAYSRVLVEAIMPPSFDIIGDNERDSAKSVIGMVYALDTQKPVIKTYSGKNVIACTNLSIFNADNLYYQNLTDGKMIYRKAKEFAEVMEADVAEFTEIYEKLKKNHYAGDELNKKIGKLLRDSFKLRMSSYITRGVSSLFDSKSAYVLNNQGETSGWNLYNAITQVIGEDKNISDRADKIVSLSRIFLQ